MKKLNKKGFLLTETLIVSTMVISILLVLYVQFKNVSRNFDNSFTYNTVSSVYNLNNAKKYIEQSNYSLIAEKLKTELYVDLTSCPTLYFGDTVYCETLFDRLNIKQLIMTNENLYSLIEDNSFETEFNDFLKTIDYDTVDGYRLIGRFEDDTYASLKILNSDEFELIISNACTSTTPVNYTISHIVITDTNSMTGYNLYDDTERTSTCGSYIYVANLANDSNSCFYVSSMSSETLDLGIDSNSNTATIYYDRYKSNLTINHYLVGTTTVISDATSISQNCGSEIITEEYKKNVSGYNYVSTSQDRVTLNRNDQTVNLYYEAVS